MSSIKKILVATDFSDIAEHVVRQSQQLARAIGAELLLLHVLEPIPYLLTGDVGYSAAAMLQVEEASTMQGLAGKHGLALLEAELRESGVRVVSRLEYGTPHRRIVEIAGSEQAQLIAMGTHGRGGLRHMLMGSVAERVARTAHVPVLTFRAAA